MRKWILIGALAVVVIIAVIVVLGLSSLGPIIRSTVTMLQISHGCMS